MTNSIKSAVSYSTIMQLLTKLIDLAAVVLYSRLLTPSELGVFAIASSIIILSTELRTLGTNTYILRAKTISDLDVRRCLAVSMLISWFLALVIFLFSGNISNFFGYEDIEYLLLIFAVTFLFAPFASVATALLAKRMQFKAIMIVRVIAQTLGFGLTVWLLTLDYSYYAIAYGVLLITLVEMILAMLLVGQITLFIPKFQDLNDVIKFGAISSLISIFRKAETIMPDLIIGKIGSSAHVAIISKSIGTHNFIVESIFQGAKNVILPYFSGLNAKDPNSLMKKFANVNEITMLIAMPVLTASFIYMEDIIYVLFGNQWGASIPIAKVLTAWMLCKLVFYHFDSVLYVLKLEKTLLKRQITSSMLLGILLVTLYDDALSYIAYSFVIVGLYDVAYNSYIIKKIIKADISIYFSALKLPCYCSILIFLINTLVKWYYSDVNQVILLGIAALVCGVIWLCFIKFTNNLISKEFFSGKS